MKITYRKINDDDFDFLRKVYRTTREYELSKTTMSEEEKQKFSDFQFNAQHTYYKQAYKNAEMNLILLNGHRAGRLYLWRTPSQIRIMDITLLPDHCGQGVGTKIVKSLIRESVESQKKLTIHVEYFNPALRLYQRFGFKKTDDTGVYYFMERDWKEESDGD